MKGTTHHNAIAILRAANRRRCGSRTWLPRNAMGCNVTLNAPRCSAFGWFSLTYHDGGRQCTIDLQRHRATVKEQARRLIAAAHAPDTRTAWRQAQIAANKGARGVALWHAISAITGAANAYDGDAGRLATRLQRLLDRPAAESDRYRRTRDVLNQFGRLNPWRRESGAAAALYRDSVRVKDLRARLLARALIAPEPGGYVTGLLSEAPARLWWDDYPRPVAPFNAADVAIWGSARTLERAA